MRGVFLDLSKAFEKVWNVSLLYKLKRMGICQKYFGVIDSFLSDRYQRVIPMVKAQNRYKLKMLFHRVQSQDRYYSQYILIIYEKDQLQMPNLLPMILRFSRWFVTLLLYKYLLMKTYPKYCNDHADRKFYLILMLQTSSRDRFVTQKIHLLQ